jgi:hypothetical protein
VCSRHAPENGADAPVPWKALVVNRDDDFDRPHWIGLNAYGRNDVRRQITELHPELLLLEAKEAA